MTVKLGFLLFAVDDAHFMDTASWEFLVDLGQDARSLVVMTMRTSSRVSCPSADLVLSSKQTLHIRLGGLHADYLGPLACQLLDVISVPEELLSILEERSRGVPSWCEQLLREMYLAGDIIIVPADSENEDLDNLDVKSNPSNAMQDDEDGPRGKNLICLIAPGKSIGTIVPDSVKGMIQANIDRMEETDQMILKCASVIGITFTRSMLQALLPFKREINVRLCLKRLIETGVFECASAPQTTGPAGFVCTIKKKKENLQEENMVLKVKCHCAGVPENQRASLLDCRYLRFHSASIQETVYGMFMEKTRVQLHCTAAKYLETKAHKCRACGGGDFIHEYGGSFQGRRPSKRKENLQTCPQETKQEKQTTNASSPPPPNSANSKGEKLLVAGENASSKRKARRGKKMTIFKRSVDRSFRSDRRVSVSANAGTDVEMTRGKGKNAIAPSFEERPMSGLGERRMTSITICSEKGEMNRVGQQKGTKLYKLLGFGDKSNTTVSEEDDTSLAAVDLRECECIQILASVYPQLVHHWRAAGNVERTVHFLIEAAAAAVGISDNIQALAYLEEVQEILKSVRNGVNPFEGELSHHVGDLTIDPLEEARVETLTGQAQYQLGQSKESVTHFLNALQILGAPQPIRVLAKYIFIGRQAFLQYRHVKYPTRYLGTASTDQIAILISQAQCLSFLFHDYISSHDDTSAGMTVLQQLNKAEEADDDLHELIIAYTSMMEYCQQKNWHGWVRMYEKTAETRCMEVLHTINADDMVTLAHLYSVGLNMRLNSGLLEEAVESGYVADRITEKLHDNDMKIHMLPLLAQALLLSNKIHKCVEVLEQLEYCDDETDDMIGQAWYYGCCMDLILESGFQYVTQKACLEFAELALRDHTFNIDHLPLYYLSAALALWFTRKGDWEKARLWTKDANKNSPKQLKTFMAAHGFCKLVECKLIAYAYSIEKKQQKQMVTLQYDAQKDIKLLKKACQHLAVFKPHVLHLEAYMLRIQNKISASKKQLTKCIQLCDVNGNILEKHWAQHSLKVWFDKNCDRFQASFWLESSQQEVLDWHMANDLSEVEDSIVKYSLPLSHWFDSKGMIS